MKGGGAWKKINAITSEKPSQILLLEPKKGKYYYVRPKKYDRKRENAKREKKRVNAHTRQHFHVNEGRNKKRERIIFFGVFFFKKKEREEKINCYVENNITKNCPQLFVKDLISLDGNLSVNSSPKNSLWEEKR